MLEKNNIDSLRRAIDNLQEGTISDTTRSIPVHNTDGVFLDFVIVNLIRVEDYWVMSLESLNDINRNNQDWRRCADAIVAEVRELGLSLIPSSLFLPDEKDMIEKLFDGITTNEDKEIYVSEMLAAV